MGLHSGHAHEQRRSNFGVGLTCGDMTGSPLATAWIAATILSQVWLDMANGQQLKAHVPDRGKQAFAPSPKEFLDRCKTAGRAAVPP